MKKLLILVSMLFFAASLFAQKEAKKTAYVFCYFEDNGQNGLHLAYSDDGYNWHALKKDSSFLKPAVSKDKLMRDPCIIRGADGLFHMVWTVSWNDKGIGYASSKDLINWSTQEFLPVMAKEEGARNCWAPEITYDSKTAIYMIYWATTITGKFANTNAVAESKYNHRLYYVTTRDFKTYSDTQLLYDPGFNSIDATIVKDGNRFVMFLKDETPTPPQKNIKIAYSDNLTGPYSAASSPITGNYWAEGPTTLSLNGQWIVYFDRYMDHKYGAIQSANLQNWMDVSDKISLPKGLRHGTIFTVTTAELKALKTL